MKAKGLCCSLFLAVLVLGAPAWAAKVKICHVPPGNPANFHTITISENALQAHLGHGDLLGACFAHCDQLCDDGNACTIDACDAAEQCVVTHPPVSCDDGNLCTIDSCDPAAGCANPPKACADDALCTVDSCDPLTGNCAFPPVACPNGETCNPDNGSCEGEELACPCLDLIPGFADALNGPLTFCTIAINPTGVVTEVGPSSLGNLVAAAITGNGEFGACGDGIGDPFIFSLEEGEACNALLQAAADAAGLTCGGPEH